MKCVRWLGEGRLAAHAGELLRRYVLSLYIDGDLGRPQAVGLALIASPLAA
jgi:hypothetical protein